MLDAEVAVIGVGAIGSQSLWNIARRGKSVIGFERSWTPNERSGHAGEHRLMHTLPVGEAGRSITEATLPAWEEFERETGYEVLLRTGSLQIGAESEPLMQAVAAGSLERDGNDRNILTRKQVNERFPHFQVGSDEIGIFDESAAAVRSEWAISRAVDATKRLGARVLSGVKVLGWTVLPDHVRISTSDGEYKVAKVVISAGAYVKELLPELPIKSRKLVLGWFGPTEDHIDLYKSIQLPTFACGVPEKAGGFVYGAASLDKPYVKVGGDFDWGFSDLVSPEDFLVRTEDLDGIRQMVRERFVGLSDSPLRSMKLVDAWSSDSGPLVGLSKQSDRLILAAGFSGGGFSIAPVMGRVVADLVDQGDTEMDITPLDPQRFAQGF